MRANFDFAHYKAIHKFLFDDLYDWAGEVRTVDLSKKGTQFVPADDIERIGNAIFAHLAEDDYFRQDDSIRLWSLSRSSIATPICFILSVRGMAGHSGYSSRN